MTPLIFKRTDVGNQFNNEEVNITGVQAFISEMTIIYTNAEPGANSGHAISLSPIVFLVNPEILITMGFQTI